MLLIALGNWDQLDDKSFMEGGVQSLFSNIGFSFLLAAVVQWIFDHKFRRIFYEDIRGEVISSQTIFDSGLENIFSNSKNADYGGYIEKSKLVRIGVTYSDRLLKDYFQCFVDNASSIEVRLYVANLANDDCLKAVAFSTKQSEAEVTGFYEAMKRQVSALQDRNVRISVYELPYIPHYSFIAFDRRAYFLTLSTYASRRAEVPTLECEDGVFKKLIEHDIAEAEKCVEPIAPPAVSWEASFANMVGTKLKGLFGS